MLRWTVCIEIECDAEDVVDRLTNEAVTVFDAHPDVDSIDYSINRDE